MNDLYLLLTIMMWAATFGLVAATAWVGIRLALWIVLDWEIPLEDEENVFLRGATRIVIPKRNIPIIRIQLGDYKTDKAALRSDWKAVGNDLRDVICKHGEGE